MKLNIKLIAFIAIMGALGNVIGLFAIPIPMPAGNVEFHLSQLTGLLTGIAIGPVSGAVAGALSVILVTASIGNVLIPGGNAILAGVAGLASKRFRPIIAGIIGEIAETPYLWFSTLIYGLPIPVILWINIKSFVEVLISSSIIEVLIRRKEIKNWLESLKTS